MNRFAMLMAVLCFSKASAQLSFSGGYTSISYRSGDLWRHGITAAADYRHALVPPVNIVLAAQYSVYFDSKDYNFAQTEEGPDVVVKPYQIIDVIPMLEYTLPQDGLTLSIGAGLAYRTSTVETRYHAFGNSRVILDQFSVTQSGFEPTFRAGCGIKIPLSKNLTLYPEAYLHNSFNRAIVRNPVNLKLIYSM